MDEFLKELERPAINPAITGKAHPRVSNISVLAKRARRRVEVLVYSADKKWWRQAPVEAGQTATKIHLGNKQTKAGTRFAVMALTTDQPLTRQTYLSLPDCRTKSAEITLTRA